MNLGLVVEGPTDKACYPELIRRIRQDLVPIQTRDCGGKSKVNSAFNIFLDEFHRNHAWQMASVLVIRDSDCKPSQEIEQKLERQFDVTRFPRFRVRFFAPKCDLETWLVADENAITIASHSQGKNRTAAPIPIQLETGSAKADFRRQLWKAGLPATRESYRQVAQSLNIQAVVNRCLSFRRFCEMLRAL